ncbi:MAG: universal stress protein [Acidobacteria bacterium]|nr:universal stress protein [Acidobacteriota bacterium]
MLRKILVPVDFSDRCAGAARYAETLAAHFHSQFILLHVLDSGRLAYGGVEVGIPGPDWYAKLKAHTKERLDGFLGAELQALAVSRILVEGDPVRRIVEYAHSEQVDLLAVSTHGYGPFRRFLLGSVAAKILHDADCPVWTGVHLEEAPAAGVIGFRRIVCALDLGPQSAAALSWASMMAREFGARLYLIHVVPPVERIVAESSEPDPADQLVRQAREEIEKLRQQADAAAEVEVATGDIARTVYEFSARRNTDLLVIGRGSSKGLVGRLRSHAYTLIRESSCPVVSV